MKSHLPAAGPRNDRRRIKEHDVLLTLLAAEEAPTAGGAAFDEILIAGAMAAAVMLPFAWITLRERQGHTTLVGRLADKMSEIDGLPRWAGLPSYLCVISLLTAGFGVWWDVPIHMQNGRDEGPLANPSHYFIFIGILGFLHAGILSIALAKGDLPRRTVKLSKSWHAPMGAFPMIGAGLIALVGFPADDLWHRLFGQDVTEWGPTHVMMIGGAVTCCLGIPLLYAEAYQVGAPGTRTLVGRLRMAISIGLCMIPIAFLMEFDLGVPQFPAATQFIIFGFLAAWTASAVRTWFGPGGALLTAGLYLVIHGFLFYSVAIPLDDVLTGRFLLFVPSAVLIELVALGLNPRRRPLPFALVSGLAVGTLGMYAEWLWSGVFMPLPQPLPADTLPVMLGAGTVAAIGGALLAQWHVARLREVAGDPAQDDMVTVGGGRTGWQRQWAGIAGLALFVAPMAYFAPPGDIDKGLTGTVEFADAAMADGSPVAECAATEERCEAIVTVTYNKPEIIEDAAWHYFLAWQGRGPGGKIKDVSQDPVAEVGGVVRVEMIETDVPGQYRSEHPVPLYGQWKSMIRLHSLPTEMGALPLHFPDDPAITSDRGREIHTASGTTVDVADEKPFLQREQKDDVPGWLFTLGYALVISSWLVLLLFFGWCYSSAARGSATKSADRDPVTV
jgi:hypothetical protein